VGGLQKSSVGSGRHAKRIIALEVYIYLHNLLKQE